MWAVSEGEARRAVPCVARRAHVDRHTRRSGTAARAARLIAAIVAGGASSRFDGEPKGLHQVGGKRIVDRIVDALSAVASDIVLIANDPAAATWLPGIRVIPDAWPTRGSLVGIHTALRFAQGAVLVVAWDMPFVVRPLFELIRDRSPTSSFATIPEGPGGLEPLCASYAPGCLPTIETQLAARNFRLSSMVEGLPSFERVNRADVERIGDPARLFFNVNSAHDLAVAERFAAMN